MHVSDATRFALSLAALVERTDRLGLREAINRILAHKLHGPRPMPFFDNGADLIFLDRFG